MLQQHWRRELGETAGRLLELVILWTRLLFDPGTFAVLLVTNLDMDPDVCNVHRKGRSNAGSQYLQTLTVERRLGDVESLSPRQVGLLHSSQAGSWHLVKVDASPAIFFCCLVAA